MDPNNRHNDPTPYPYYDYKNVKFTVQTYYAIIQSITTTPSGIVNEGDQFTVTIHVAYRFPGPATLRVDHFSNSTSPPIMDEKTDNAPVTGTGTKDYTFKARAPYTQGCAASWTFYGYGSVKFNRGQGWQITDPGYWGSYTLTVKAPAYYATFTSVTAQYAGSANATGHVIITLVVKYLLPLQTGLRITITRFDNASKPGYPAYGWQIIVQDESSLTQTDTVERTVTYVYTYTLPSMSSNTLTLIAAVDYLACYAWHHGDQQTTTVPLPYTPPSSNNSIPSYFTDAVQRIISWLKKLFGYGQ